MYFNFYITFYIMISGKLETCYVLAVDNLLKSTGMHTTTTLNDAGLEDLPKVMVDKDRWQKRIKEIHAVVRSSW